MSHKHHSCSCEHAEVKYCKHCDTVYCKDCNREWPKYPSYTYTYTGGAGIYNGSITTCSGNTGGLGAASAQIGCEHN